MKPIGVWILSLFIVGGLLIGGLLGYILTIDTEDKVLDCYDRDRSKIIGMECIKKGHIFGDVERFVTITMFAVVLAGAGGLMSTIFLEVY